MNYRNFKDYIRSLGFISHGYGLYTNPNLIKPKYSIRVCLDHYELYNNSKYLRRFEYNNL